MLKNLSRRCLVTGGTGFLGSHLVKRLLKEGLQVAVLLRAESDTWRIKEELPTLTLIYGELAEIGAIRSQLKAYQPDLVIHCGWSGVTREQRDDFNLQIKTNLLGSIEFLKICLEAGCSNWIGLGSQAEYGSTDRVLVEAMQPNPDTLYGAAKLSVGQLSQVLCKAAGTRPVWLRLAAAYGPMDDPAHMIPYVITTLLKNESPKLGRGNRRWDYLYIEDVVNAIWLAVQKQEVMGTFNLSAGEAVEIRRICEIIRDNINVGTPLLFDRLPERREERDVLLADNQRFCQLTGWSPATSIEQGLDETIVWYKGYSLAKKLRC